MRDTILLVHPWIYDFAAYDFGIEPLGLLRIASHLRQKHDVCLVDCLAGCARSKRPSGFSKIRKERVEHPPVLNAVRRPYFRYGISIDAFKDKLLRVKNPTAIYVTSGMTYWYPGVQLAIRVLQYSFPETPITLGGIYATLCFEHAVLASGADYVHRGPYIKDDFRQWLPAYDLLEDRSVLPICLSRGCPFRCSYCASETLNPVFTQRDPVRVFEEIMYYKQRFGTTSFVFYDDALFYRPRSGIKRLLRIIKAAGEKFTFYTPNGVHAHFVDEELACLLRETGFRDVRLSLETADEKIQKSTGDKVDNADIKKAVILLKEAGFEKCDIGVYILVGAPWVHIERTKEDILFVHSLGARAVLASYSPIPGTRDYDALVESGVIEEDIDPLWHNKAVFSERLMPGMIDEIRSLRRFASRINAG